MKKIRAVASIIFILMGGRTAILGLGVIFAGERKIWNAILFIIGLAIVLAAIDFWHGNERARKILVICTWLWLVLNVVGSTLFGFGFVSQVGSNNLGSFAQILAMTLVIFGIPTAIALWLLKKSAPQPKAGA